MGRSIDIPEGRLNDYLVHGFFVAIAGAILFLVHWSLTIVMLLVAIALFRVSSGMEIDPAGKRIRIYKALGKVRSGSWLNIGQYDTLSIRYTNESQTMGGRGPELTVRVRTYDLYLIGSNGASQLFHEFTDYAKARKCAEAMARLWSMRLTDEIQERRQRAQVNVATRRR